MRTRPSAGSRVFDTLNMIVMIAVIFLTAYPFWYVICYSLSHASELKGGLIFWPRKLSFTGFQICFLARDSVNAIFISLARSFIGTIVNMIFTSVAAYALTFSAAPGIRFLRKFFVMVMYVGGGLIPYYLVVRFMGLVGSFWVYIVPSLVSVMGMILTRAFIETLPTSLQESAFIDGATELKAFFWIIFPMCKPVVAALAMFTFIGQWNSYFDTMLFNFMDRKLYTLQFLLFNTLNSASTTSLEVAKMHGLSRDATNPQTISMAITVITMLPILVIYPFIQRYFKSGLLMGAVKA